MPVSELRKFKFIFPILFFLVSGCSFQGLLGPEPFTEIVVLAPELSTQQTVSECNVKANRNTRNKKGTESEVYTGFQKQEKFGECMNIKGFAWGHQ